MKIISTISTDEHSNFKMIDNRLLRHFGLIAIDQPSDDVIYSVVHTLLKINTFGRPFSVELHESLVKFLTDVLRLVKNNLKRW